MLISGFVWAGVIGCRRPDAMSVQSPPLQGQEAGLTVCDALHSHRVPCVCIALRPCSM